MSSYPKEASNLLKMAGLRSSLCSLSRGGGTSKLCRVPPSVSLEFGKRTRQHFAVWLLWSLEKNVQPARNDAA